MPTRRPENQTLTEGAAPTPGERSRPSARSFLWRIGPATLLLALANLVLHLAAPFDSSALVPLSPYPSGYTFFVTLFIPLFLAGSSLWNFVASGGESLPRLTVASEWVGLLLLPLSGVAAHLVHQPRSLLVVQGCLYLIMIMVRLGGGLVLARARIMAGVNHLWPVIAGLPFVIYLGLFFWLGTTSSTTGDEPYYLMVADSMAHDLDVSLDNQFQRSRYRTYYWGGRLLPQNMYRSASGWQTTAYTTLFPLVLSPGSLWHPRWGPTLIVILISSCLAAQIFRFTRELTGDAMAAFFAWASASFSLPLASFSSQVYPETTAALMTCLLFRQLLRSHPTAGRGRSFLRVFLPAAFLPLLKARYLPLTLTGLLLWGGRSGRLRRIALVAAGAAAALALLVVVDRHLLGGTLFAARFHSLNLIFRPRKLLRFWPSASTGLLADQEFGLLFHSPFYFLLPAGFILALLRKDVRSTLLAVPVTAYAVVLIGHFGHLWYGGFSQPGRYLVVLIPLLAPFLGWVWKEARGPWLFGLTGVVTAWSALVTVPYFLLPGYRNNQADGVNGILKALRQATGFPVDRAFPSLVNADAWSGGALLALWLALLLPSLLVLATRPRAGTGGTARRAAGVLLLAAAVSAVWMFLCRPTTVLEAEAMTHSGGKLYTAFARGPVWLFEAPGFVEGKIRTGGGGVRMTATCGVRAGSRSPMLRVLLDGAEVGRIPLEGRRGSYLRREYRLVFGAAPGIHTLRLEVSRPPAGGRLSVYLDRIRLDPNR